VIQPTGEGARRFQRGGLSLPRLASNPFREGFMTSTRRHQLPDSRPAWRREDGAALVEFALVLPLLLLLLIGMMEFGRGINYWLDTSHLANIGARWAAVDNNPGPGDTLQESIRMEADTPELQGDVPESTSVPAGVEVCINFPDETANVGDPVEVKVSVDYNWMPLIGEAIGAGTTTLTGSATMRLEQVPSEFEEGCE
jgi:Flp pilus assembly pilin Flp